MSGQIVRAMVLGLCVAAASWAQSVPADSVDFVLSRGKVVVPVHVNGVGPYAFLLDVGAELAVIDKAAATYLALPSTAPGQPVLMRSLQAGKLGLMGVPARVADLAPLEARAGLPVQGLLPGALGPGALAIDFARGTVSVGDVRPRNSDHTAPLKGGKSGLEVDVLLNGKHRRPARLDTTYGGVLALPESLVTELKLIPANAPRLEFEQPEGPAPPLEAATQVRLASVSVGGAEVLEPPCTLAAAGEELRLGTGFLKYFRVVVDQRNRRLYLSGETAEAVTCEPMVGYGIVLGGRDGGYWRVYTTVNGPAYRAGVKSGDRVESIDGRSQKDVPYAEIAARLAAAEGTGGKFTFLRGEEKREAAMTAEKVF